MSDRNCQECSKTLPSWAEFCPFCGLKYRATTVMEPVAESAPMLTEVLYLGTTSEAFVDEAPATQALHRVNPAPLPAHNATAELPRAQQPTVNHAAVSLFDSDPWDPDEFDEPLLRSRSQMAIVGITALLTLVALGYGAFLLATQSSVESVGELAAADISKEAPISEPAPTPLPELRPFDVSLTDKKPASVTYDGKEVLQIATAKGSRYDTVEQRAKSVTVRLEHIAKKQRESRHDSARFIARVNGDRYEVVWDDGSAHPFRITDVTKHDLEKGQDLAIEANLRADALTDLFRRSIAPVDLPNS